MKKIILVLFFNLIFINISKAQSNYPNCKGNDVSKWSSCYSEYTFPKDYNFKKFGKYKKNFSGDLKNTYQGEWLNGLPHGKGRFYYANGFEYSGGFQQGLISGKGLMKFSKHKSYNGDWLDSEFDGLGTIISYENNNKVEIQSYFKSGKYSDLCYKKDFYFMCKITIQDQSGNKTTAFFNELKKDDSVAKKTLQKIIGK